MAKGIDRAARISGSLASCLSQQGYTFAVRYTFDYSNVAAELTSSEVDTLRTHNLYVVNVWENSGSSSPVNQAYFTQSQGQKDGKDAFLYAANTLNQPASTPVYFAVDFDAVGAGDKNAVLNYFSGVAQGYQDYLNQQQQNGNPQRQYAIGVYGSYDVLTWTHNQAHATYFWQAYAPAWSAGRNQTDWPAYSLRQTANGQQVCNTTVDIDQSNGYGGGWQ